MLRLRCGRSSGGGAFELEHGGSDTTPDVVDICEVLGIESINPEAVMVTIDVACRLVDIVQGLPLCPCVADADFS